MLAVSVGGISHAQENAAPAAVQGAAPSMIAPPASTADLPFVNEGANQPVLQALSPDGVAIEPMPGETHAHGEKKAGLPQFDATTFPRQLFWLAIVFTLMYVVFATKTLPSIGGVIEKRRDHISGDLRAAEGLKAQIDAVRGEYESAIAKAQADAQKMMADITADHKRSAEAQDAAFKAKSEEAAKALEAKLDAGRGRIVADLNVLAADLAVDITNRVAGVKADTSAARSIIDAQIGNMKAA